MRAQDSRTGRDGLDDRTVRPTLGPELWGALNEEAEKTGHHTRQAPPANEVDGLIQPPLYPLRTKMPRPRMPGYRHYRRAATVL
jgi:hypothetical protein